MSALPREDIFQRTRAYYSGSVLEKLGNMRVSVVGAGGVGTEVCKNLAMLGLENITVCDPDNVSASNLNRGVFFRPGDVDRTHKVHAVRRGVRNLGLGVVPNALAKPVEEVPDSFWDADLVCCCVDNDAARMVVNLQLLARNTDTARICCINGVVGRGLVAVSVLTPGCTACLTCGWTREHYEEILGEQVASGCDPFFLATVTAFPQISPLTSLAGAWIAYLVAEFAGAKDEEAPRARVLRLDLDRSRFFDGEACRNRECVEPLCRDR